MLTLSVAASITTAKVMTMPTYVGMMGMIRLFTATTATATCVVTDIACPSAPRSLLVLNPIEANGQNES